MKNAFLFVTIFFFLAASCSAQLSNTSSNPPSSPDSEPLPQPSAESTPAATLWTSDQTLINSLSDEVSVGDFVLRPPKDYSLVEIPGPQGAKFFNWTGSLREDKTYPHLTLSIVAVSPEEDHTYSPTESLQILLSGIEQNRGEWSVSMEEKGQINGVDFVRAYWTGTDKTSGIPMKGFMYVMVDGKNIVSLASQDSLANESALKIAEAAALTFRRQ